MTAQLLTYTFSVSGPFPDENGVINEGTAIRVAGFSGEARAYNIQEATGYVLNNPTVKALAEYNGIDIETIIGGTNPTESQMLSLSLLDNGMSVCFSVKQK